MSQELMTICSKELSHLYSVYFDGNTDKNELIKAVSNELIQKHQIVWYRQSEDFKLELLRLLNEKTSLEEIITALTKPKSSEPSPYAAHAYPKQTLCERIGSNWLTSETLLSILPKGRPNSPVEILAPANMTDESISIVMLAAAEKLRNPAIQHVMFPLGPGHWYWIKISKDSPYTLEVFDPYNRPSDDIFNFLRPHLHGIGIQQYNQRQGQFTIAQTDAYSCGYFVAAKAHELLHKLDPEAPYQPRVVETMNRYGNDSHQLRDCFIEEFGVREEASQRVDDEPHELKKPALAAKDTQHIKEILKDKPHPHYQVHIHSLFSIKNHILETAKKIKTDGKPLSELTDLEIAYLEQAEEFKKLKN